MWGALVILCVGLAVHVRGEIAGSRVCEIKQVRADVVIVGAGYAGLSAARKLVANNMSVVVLEASNATGGRTKNYCLKSHCPDVESDYVVELGGQWIGNSTVQPHSWELIVEDLGFEVFSGSYTPPNASKLTAMSTLYATTGVHKFTTLEDAFHKLPKNVQAELKRAWDELDSYAATIDLEHPYLNENARAWDSKTFTSWINETVQLQESRTVLNVLCTTMIAQSPDVVSFLHIVFYIRAADGMKNLVVNEQQYRVRGGTQAPTFQMAKELGSDRVLLSTPVRRIALGNSDTDVETDCGEGALPITVSADDGDSGNRAVEVRARYAIVTGAPPTTGKGIVFWPPLPFEKDQLFQRMPMGNSVKAQLIYPHPFWRKKGHTGTILASTPPFGKNDYLLSNCFDNTPYAGSPGVLLCFVEGETSTQMMRLTHEERVKFIANWLSKTLGDEAKNSSLILNLLDFNWAAQPYIGGAYTSYLPPGAWTSVGHTLREPVQNMLYWAGAEYAKDGFGYINGAIQSAGAVVQDILASVKEGRSRC